MTELTRLKRFGEKQTFMTRFIITSYVRLMNFKPKDYLPQLTWKIVIISRTETRSREISMCTEKGIISKDGKFIPYTNIILAKVHEEYCLTNYPGTITISSKCYLNRVEKGYYYFRSIFIGGFQCGISDIGPEKYRDPFLSYYHLSTLLGHLNKNDMTYHLSQTNGILTVLVHDKNNENYNVMITPDPIKNKLIIFAKDCNRLYTGSQAAKLIDEMFNS